MRLFYTGDLFQLSLIVGVLIHHKYWLLLKVKKFGIVPITRNKQASRALVSVMFLHLDQHGTWPSAPAMVYMV